MKQVFLSILLAFMMSLNVKGQSYVFSKTFIKDGVTVVFNLEATGVDVNLDDGGNGCSYNIEFRYEAEFYIDGVKTDGNTKNISLNNIRFQCGESSNQIPSSYFLETEGSGVATSNLRANGKDCHSMTVLKSNCLTLKFGVGGSTYSIEGTSTLPIELITFDAIKKDRQVDLFWKTASENNNDYFTIERSVDGFIWENIKTIEGAGNSSRVLDYSWTDASPYAGVSYYRLKQTDFDGATETFNIVSIEQTETNQLQAYPNPVQHTSTLVGVDENQRIRIYNTMGVEVTGNVNISVSPTQKTYLI